MFKTVVCLLCLSCTACGLTCYSCDGKGCNNVTCSPGLDRCSSIRHNALVTKTCSNSAACVAPTTCCSTDLCNGATPAASSSTDLFTGATHAASSILLLMASSAIVTLFL
uniref:UPAR/Ly6 domain-containing protein n=1 Tax=Gasterosteus aculeatus aculeatus TaxID=481459 RepID=A0AAQ4NR67_GASAC